MDLILPAAFLFGIVFIAQNYSEQKKIAIAFIVIGVIYFILRIIYMVFPIFIKNNWKWFIKCTNKISEIFVSRLRNDKDDEQLDNYCKEMRAQIDLHDYNLQFDDFHFPFKKRLFDTLITVCIWIVFLVLILIGWRKMLKDHLDGQNLDDLVLVLTVITVILFCGVCLRILINCAWLVRPIEGKIFAIFYKLRNIAYKGVLFIMNLSVLPVLTMVLSASATTEKKCNWYQYYDYKSNADSFLQYFMARKGTGCVNCSKYSANFVEPCNSICYYDPSINPLTYKILIDSPHISETELTDVYLVPTILLEIFYLSIFYQIFRQIFLNIYDVLTILPGPTKNIECKFQTLIFTLESAGASGFRSYRYKSAFYNFTFTHSKLFVTFLTSLLTVIPIKILKRNHQRITPWIYFFTDIIISVAQLYSTPYISILHNIVNFAAYVVAGVTSLLVGLHVCQIFTISTGLGNFLFVLCVITPILTALITPFFARRDKFLVPTTFDLLKIIYWDKKLNLSFRKKMVKMQQKQEKSEGENSLSDEDDINNSVSVNLTGNELEDEEEENSNSSKKITKNILDKDSSVSTANNNKINNNDDDYYDYSISTSRFGNILDQEESSASISYFKRKKDEDEREHDSFVSNFNLLKLAPIEVQEGIQANKESDVLDGGDDDDINPFKDDARHVWPRIDLHEELFDKAVSEMLESANKLIDSIAYNGIMTLVNLTIIISSACLGWSLSAGIIRWDKVLGENGDDFYVRCNMFNNGTYPAFGSY